MKKMEYHRDLLLQIEQKKKEQDVQKAKEKEYDEKLTRFVFIDIWNTNRSTKQLCHCK